MTSSGSAWGTGPQWGTGGAGASSGGGSVAGGTGANMQVQTYNWPSSKGASSPALGSVGAPSNQTASVQPALNGSPIDDLLKATSK